MKLSNVAHITETSRYQKKEEAYGLPFSCLKTEEKKMAFYQGIWAQIDEDGVVQNRMVCDNYEDANYVTRCTYGEKALAVEINLWDVSEGCKYIDGTFYHEDGKTPCAYLPDEEERVSAAETRADAAEEAMNTILTDVIPSIMQA